MKSTACVRTQSQSAATTRGVACRGLKENVARLAPISDVQRVRIPSANWSVENVEGKKASVAIYAHLSAKHGGRLGKAAALEGLQLYDEVVADARQRPGAHPNIDLLLKVAEEDLSLDLVVDRQ